MKKFDRNLPYDGWTKACNRRRFLTVSAAAAAAGLSGCSSMYRRLSVKMHQGTRPLPPTRVYPGMPPATVAAAGVRSSVEDAVRQAIEGAGGLAEVEKGQRVMIKPNATCPVSGQPRPVTTSVEVLRAVIRMVRDRGARPLLGDRSAVMDLETMRQSGYDRLCRDEGAEFSPWMNSEYVRFLPRQRHWSQGFRFPRILTEVDHWINVPVLKNHQVTAAEFTCCLKAFVGVCHPRDRMQSGEDALHLANIGEKIAELNLCSKPLLNVVDATEIMISGGPDGLIERPLWVKPGLVLASRDRVACDSLAVAVLKRFGAEEKVIQPYVQKSVWDQVQIYRAAELGIGQADPRQISLVESGVPDFAAIRENWA